MFDNFVCVWVYVLTVIVMQGLQRKLDGAKARVDAEHSKSQEEADRLQSRIAALQQELTDSEIAWKAKVHKLCTHACMQVSLA